MNEHPLRDHFKLLLHGRDQLNSEQARALTEHLESCSACQETIEELLSDPIVERCRAVVCRVNEFLQSYLTIDPAPAPPSADRTEIAIRFPGPPTPDAPLGWLGRYAIIEKVGKGGFGVVFKAMDPRLNRTVAIKVLRPEHVAHPKIRARFENEARAVASVLHFDHVVQIYEVVADVTDDFCCPYLVMEWIEGPTLQKYQETTDKLSWREAVRIIREVAQGLSEIHQHITAHRDLKPPNIMLVKANGRTKIMDFGLALPIDVPAEQRLTQAGDLFGTLAYMSPEHARREPVLDGRSDIFSLGIVLYELLAGRLPFQGSNLALLKAINDTDPTPLRRINPTVPRDLGTIVHKCLAKNPADRYQRASDLAEDLRRLEDGRPITAHPPSLVDQLWKLARRYPVAASLAAALVLLLIAAGIAGWVVGRREAELRGAAETERDRTKEQRDQATEQRDRARALEHAERVERARALARRGLWTDARQIYDQAIADDRPDADSLRVERLRCLFVYGERPKLAAELEGLAARKDLTAVDMALVSLHRADDLLTDFKRQKEGMKLLAQSLEIAGGLTGADRAYAEGLAAPAAETAVERFRAALGIDPFHHRANSALLTALLFLGRFEEARLRADFMKQAFRDDPLPAFADAWTALLAGDRQACFRHLEPIDKLTGEKRAKELRTFFTLTGDLLDFGDRINLEDPAALVVPMFKAAFKVANLSAIAPGALEPFGFGVPTITRLTGTLEELRLAVLDFTWGNGDAAYSRMEKAHRTHPDAILLYVQAIAQVQRAATREKKDHARAVQLGTEARDLFYRAADAPTILPRASWRYEARLAGLAMDYAISTEPLPADPLRFSRMRNHAERAADQGRALPKSRLLCLPKMIDKNTLDLETARFLVAAWLRDEPDAPLPLRQIARLDLRAGNYASALRVADRLLRDLPGDRELLDTRKHALAGMRKTLD